MDKTTAGQRILEPMTMSGSVLALCCTLTLVACAPQAELVKTRSDMTGLRDEVNAAKQRSQDVQRQLDKETQSVQKRLDGLEATFKASGDVQKSLADFGARFDQLQTDIQLLQGKLEENHYRIAELAQKADDRGVKLAELTARIEALEQKIRSLSAGEAPAAGQTATSSPVKESSTANPVGPSDAYRQAKADYDKGNYDLALAGFQNYLVQFSDTSQAPMAQYWIGECYYAKGELKKAIDSFEKVVKHYPKSDKVSGAKLKIGLSYLNEKNAVKAKEYFNKVIKEYPGTNEAEIAKDRLGRIVK